MYSYRPPHMAEQKQGDQLEHTYIRYVRIRDVALKTRQKRWTIGKSGKRGSGISVLAARHDDVDDYDDNYNSFLIRGITSLSGRYVALRTVGIFSFAFNRNYTIKSSPVGWDCWIYRLHLCGRVRPHPCKRVS